MIRFFTEYLIEWKNRTHRKPMIVRGARQVGKTFTIEEFGNENFDETIKINFEETPDLKQFFQTNDTEQIIRNLEIYFGKQIVSFKAVIEKFSYPEQYFPSLVKARSGSKVDRHC